jgi:hypothetical protein
MRDLAVFLRRELESLEAQLATDPRLQKAQKIRELLAMYGDTSHATAPTISSLHSLAAGALARKPSKADQIRFAIQSFMRPKGSAVLARTRLMSMAETNNWPKAAPAAIQLQKDATGPLSSENISTLCLGASAAASTAPLAPAPNGASEPHGHS